jgi:hypothetical protein
MHPMLVIKIEKNYVVQHKAHTKCKYFTLHLHVKQFVGGTGFSMHKTVTRFPP